MASVNKSARSAAKSGRGLSRSFVLGALLSCSFAAGSVWGLASTLSAMHEAAHTLSEGTFDLKLVASDTRRFDPAPKAVKSSRFLQPTESELREARLTDDAIRKAHQRSLAVQLALAEKRKRAEAATLLALAVPVKTPAEPQEKTDARPSLVTALVEDVPADDSEPFDLVLPKEDPDEAVALPGEIPLPETRPLTETAAPGPKSADQKPAARKSLGNRQDVAVAKPGRSLFGDLFNHKASTGAWQGNAAKVAIYDVSNATVYLPDGTKLRAHSGIGNMRDNPRYENVAMRGPTPAGTYRLSMREKRFYGVEAIRMTSIDGRDPKNRTGLLTHTNLLRGRIGSHGCVAFQDYQPFLRAFKRGQISTLVVVPELPSSPTQLAALYRKAGA
nr:DUF2778 domain-containing protein [uncultured Gellertiella sp.]